MRIIAIHALLARINRKLAPRGKIYTSTTQETRDGLGMWHITENNTVGTTLDSREELVQYGHDIGVLAYQEVLGYRDAEEEFADYKRRGLL